MNEDTRISVWSTESNTSGCLVKLDFGEIFIDVEHDGRPFVVETIHGQVIITGTVLDVRATTDEMALIVAEGSVRFGAHGTSVDVGADEISHIRAGSAPSEPVSCDAVEQTAWAAPYKAGVMLADAYSESRDDLLEALPLPTGLFAGDALAVHELDYDSWVRKRQAWFKRQFPEVFQLREALADAGIEVDYPDLLVRSSVIWRFGYRPVSQQRLLPVDDAAIAQAAAHYGMDSQWLRARRLIGGASAPSTGQALGAEAFALWTDQVGSVLVAGQEMDEQVLLASLHACVYLLNTRSLIGLAVESSRYQVPGLADAEAVLLVRRQAEAAYRAALDVIAILGHDRDSPSCRAAECEQRIQDLGQEIAEIADVEKTLAGAMTQVYQ